MIPKSTSMDDWAQLARYRVANLLVNTGLTSDARGLYQQLLSLAKKPSKRAVILREIQN